MRSLDSTITKLKAEGFKLTPQRISVIKYMEGNPDHPSAGDIYKALKKKYPGLAFSTVYNTLRMLQKIGEIQAVNIAEDHMNYDPDTSSHFHLLCEECGKIVDIPSSGDLAECFRSSEISGHEVKSYQINMRGTCSSCLCGSSDPQRRL
ncbi:MAG: transcriptional repressor [Candidatus Krumholzibacteriota bacterium]|nr:transcriptional repressor [Candidatus Krumholzibacteriota bacterium]